MVNVLLLWLNRIDRGDNIRGLMFFPETNARLRGWLVAIETYPSQYK